MPVVIDTNVLIAANGRDCPQSTSACQLTCSQQLRHTQTQDVLVIDDGFHSLGEYLREVSPTGQPGVGDAFLKWVVTNPGNSAHYQQIHITPTASGSFQEFPDTPDLKGFDPSDHKFIATTLSHPETSPILNAVDSDWQHYDSALAAAGVTVHQLCPDTPKSVGY
jgi:hypothetical protein